LVSICCLTYNHENFIKKALDGFLIQETNFDFEIIVYDDASDDKTQTIIKKYVEKYPDKIFPIFQKENKFSQGIKISNVYVWPKTRGKYIALCEGDDYWTDPLKLQKQVNFLEQNDDYVITYHNSKVINEVGEITSNSNLPDVNKKDFSEDELIKGRWIITLTMCFRNVLKEYPSYLWGDTALTSFLGNSGKGKYLDSIEDGFYRMHPTSMWSSKSEEYKKSIQVDIFGRLNKLYCEIGKPEYQDYFKNMFNERMVEVFNILHSKPSLKVPEQLVKTINDYPQLINSQNKLVFQKINTEQYKTSNGLIEESPLFSLIMPNYNNENHIAQAIDSVLNQTYKNWELIIVDDSSTDNSVDVISSFLHDKRINLIKLDKNRGVANAKVTGIKKSNGPIFGTMGADDALVEDTIEVMVAAHLKYSECGLIYPQFIYCDENLNPVRKGFSAQVQSSSTNLDQNVVSNIKTYKKCYYNLTEGYDVNLRFAEDKDISYKMEEVSKLHFVDKELYMYRVHENSISNKKGSYTNREQIITGLKTKAIYRRLDKAKKTSKNEIEYFKNATEYLSQKEFNKATSQIKEYQSRIDYSSLPYHDNAKIKNPEVSIIIVAYNTNKELVKCIKSVLQNNVRDYEIIVVDNGGNDKVLFELLELPIKYIRTPINFTPSEGRNIGVHFSKGKIVAFLDDDALVPANYIESIIQAFLTYDIVGFRGKVLPKTKSKNNQLAEHYNLGEVPIPASINTEGNSAFLREKYLNVGGMNPLLFGGEGMELSYRMAKINSMNSTIYWPKTIIYHD
ncbi:MAG: glycosyltransferase, partial [Ignavibacteriae bacterium]|nr:glycosyltransferase [Ignavibacteriota bacterium]